jgi:uncharacterized protein YjbJ (UPF0337 family)
MKNEITQGKWKQVRGAIKQAWGRATADRVLVLNGERESLTGRLQVRAARALLEEAAWTPLRQELARPPVRVK